MIEQLHHDALDDLIDHEGWWFRAAELHGMLTALISCNRPEQSFALLFGQQSPSPLAKMTIERLSEHIQASLAATELNFRLLLPENTSPAVRAEALLEWIEGFLLGEKFIAPVSLDKECQAFLTDLQEIAKLDTALADNEENRRLLNNLEEHCRLGALMLYAHTHRPIVGKTQPKREKK